MMETKRWSVTYTKHVKQKRKVYHDGVLELSGSGEKVMLYDDCDNLIYSKHTKKDDIIECGASLTFETHLVDIGEPEKNGKCQMGLDDEKLNVRTGKLGEKNKRNTLQIRSQQNYSNVICSSIKDNSKNTLQIRRPHKHTNVLPSSSKVSNKTEFGSSGVLQSSPDATETTPKEWNALYTTQKTQKAKRYHDGILRLADCGSHMKQVILLNEDGAMLSNKYIKSAEFSETGHTFEFPNYLVEIGDRRVSPGDDIHKDTSRPTAWSSSTSIGNFTSTGKNYTNKPLPTEDLQKGYPKQATKCSSSNALKQSTNTRLIDNKRLRDACQILSVLKKPLPGEILHQTKLPVEHTCYIHSSVIINLDVQNASETLKLNSPGLKYARENHEHGSQELNVSEAAQTGTSGGTCSNSKSIQATQTASVTIDIDPNQEGKFPEYEHSTMCNRFSTAAAEMGVEYEGNNGKGVSILAAGSISSKPNTCTSPSRENAADTVFSGDGISKNLVATTSKSLLTEEGSRCFSHEKQQIEDSSSSSVLENVNIGGSSSFSGMHDNSAVSANNVKHDFAEWVAGQRCDESSPPCEAMVTECKDSELQCLSKNYVTMDNFPTFDLGI